ncbi:MAG: hypothetical protein Q9187_004358 [Circinaria calcarea]
MVFTAPEWVPALPFEPFDSIPLCDFMLDERYGRQPLSESRPPFTCGLTGKEYSALEVRDRVDWLARGLSKELGWQPNVGTEWDKVIGVFSLNTIDTLTLNWATHRLSGISSPANAAYSAEELSFQLKSSGSKALFTCLPLLPVALDAASKSGISKNHIYLLSLPAELTGGQEAPADIKTVDQLIENGRKLPQLEALKWTKGVMISHRNVIANVLQLSAFEQPYRDAMKDPNTKSSYVDVALGLLPQSHIYSLVVACHATGYRGDQNINLAKFELNTFLNAIQRFKISALFLVPPIIITMTKNKDTCAKYDLSSVKFIFSGAAPLGAETAEGLQKQYPEWIVRQGYGLTETCTVVSSSAYDDVCLGSSGSLLPSIEARLVTPEGAEITGYDQPGELLVKSPTVVLGYLNNDAANAETFQDGWMRTGDEAVFRKGPKGTEHVFIVDRIKELIKVKGLQVAPAELEAHLLTHDAVADVAVIPIPDDAAGEVPKAFVVKSSSVGLENNDRMIQRDIQKHVEKHKARHKWLKGGVEFINVIPKSPSGKILRRLLRDKDKAARRMTGARL